MFSDDVPCNNYSSRVIKAQFLLLSPIYAGGYLSRLLSRRTRPVRPQNCKPNISLAFLHQKIEKHF